MRNPNGRPLPSLPLDGPSAGRYSLAMMAEAPKTTEAPSEAAKPQTKKVFCFVSKREIQESDAIEVPYTNGQRVWVGKAYVKH